MLNRIFNNLQLSVWPSCYGVVSMSASTWSLTCMSNLPKHSEVNTILRSVYTVLLQTPLPCSFSLNNKDTVGSVLLFLWTIPSPLTLNPGNWRLGWGDSQRIAIQPLSLSTRRKVMEGERKEGRCVVWTCGGGWFEMDDYCWQRRNVIGLQVRTTSLVVCMWVCVFAVGVHSCMLFCLSLPEVPYCSYYLHKKGQ